MRQDGMEWHPEALVAVECGDLTARRTRSAGI